MTHLPLCRYGPVFAGNEFENGLLVRTEDEWVAALRRLLDDAGLRRRLGEQARKDAVAKYSTKVIAAQYRRVLDSVMANNG